MSPLCSFQLIWPLRCSLPFYMLPDQAWGCMPWASPPTFSPPSTDLTASLSLVPYLKKSGSTMDTGRFKSSNMVLIKSQKFLLYCDLSCPPELALLVSLHCGLFDFSGSSRLPGLLQNEPQNKSKVFRLKCLLEGYQVCLQINIKLSQRFAD